MGNKQVEVWSPELEVTTHLVEWSVFEVPEYLAALQLDHFESVLEADRLRLWDGRLGIRLVATGAAALVMFGFWILIRRRTQVLQFLSVCRFLGEVDPDFFFVFLAGLLRVCGVLGQHWAVFFVETAWVLRIVKFFGRLWSLIFYRWRVAHKLQI